MQHSEIIGLRELYPSWVPLKWRRSWNEKWRPEIALDSCHESVLKRLQLPSVSNCGIQEPYRPECLRKDPALAHYYPQDSVADKSPHEVKTV